MRQSIEHRTSSTPRIVGASLLMPCVIAGAVHAHGALGSCEYESTVTSLGADGALVTVRWGTVWGNSCEWDDVSLTVSEGRIDLNVLQTSDWCFATPMAVCYGPVPTPGPVAPGTYDVHVNIIQAWEGSDGAVMHSWFMETLVIDGAEPCGTIVESDFNDGSTEGWTFVDVTFAGVGEVESADGAARLFTTASITALNEYVVLGVAESETTPDLYADGTVEFVWRSATSRPAVQLGARLDVFPDANAGYVFSCIAEPFNAVILQRGDGAAVFPTIASVPFAFVPNVDYRVRMSFIGDALECTVWVDGEREPAPQISLNDPFPVLAGGSLGFAAARSQGTGLVDISFSDFTFTLPNECEDPGVFGDLNGDGVVDGADLGLLLNNWGGDGAGDLNGDGIVDGADLGLLLNNWS